MIRKQWIVRAGIGPGGQVAPDGLGGGGVYVDGALSSLAPSEDAFVALV